MKGEDWDRQGCEVVDCIATWRHWGQLLFSLSLWFRVAWLDLHGSISQVSPGAPISHESCCKNVYRMQSQPPVSKNQIKGFISNAGGHAALTRLTNQKAMLHSPISRTSIEIKLHTQTVHVSLWFHTTYFRDMTKHCNQKALNKAQ